MRDVGHLLAEPACAKLPPNLRPLLLETPGTSLAAPPSWLVAITAATMEGDRERCLAAGMDDYLSKPMRFEKLASVVAECVG